MVVNIVFCVIGLLVGLAIMYFIQKSVLKSKADTILKEANAEAEVIKKNKLLEVKEKFLNKKAELEKEVAQRNQKFSRLRTSLSNVRWYSTNVKKTCCTRKLRMTLSETTSLINWA